MLKGIIFFGVLWLLKFKLELEWGKSIILGVISAVVVPLILTLVIIHPILIVVMIIIIIVFGVMLLKPDKNVFKEELNEWVEKNFKLISPFEFSNLILSQCDISNVKYSDEIPYYRAKYFSSGSIVDVDTDEIFTILFDAEPNKDEVTFQEYGYLITTAEIIIKKRIKNDKKEFITGEQYIPFDGIYKVLKSDSIIKIYLKDETMKSIKNLSEDESKIIYQVISTAIECGWTKNSKKIINNDGVTAEEAAILEENLEQKMNKLDDAVFDSQNDLKFQSNLKGTGAAVSGINSYEMHKGFSENQINDRFGDGQGHAHAGEQFGNTKDKLLGKNAQMKGNDHAKNGADRIVNGRNIQTKYCANAGKSIGQCFDNGMAKYTNPDGTMMQIEVPRDQYSKAVKLMEKRIESGQVPNENNPSKAVKYVKRGAISYEHSQIATKSIFDRSSEIIVRDNNGKIMKDANNNPITRKVTVREKMVWSAGGDFATGVSMALPSAVIAGVWIYCSGVWQGQDKKEALKASVIGMAKPCLMTGTIYMVSAQFAGSNLGKNIGNKILRKTLSNKAKTSLMTNGSMVVITAAVTVGPDLVDCLRGKISMQQLIKNTVTTGAGAAGGMIAGATLGSIIPGPGTLIGAGLGLAGGALGSKAAKNALDRFIEDDAVEMMKIAKEEFIETVMMTGLSQEEFQDVLNQTFLHKKFSNMLKDMYASNIPREYIHTKLFDMVIKAYSSRSLPNEEEIFSAVETQNKLLVSA